MTQMVTSGSMSGEEKRSDGLLGESGNERRRSFLAPPDLHATALLLDSTLLHGGAQLAGWRTAQIHTAILQAFGLTTETYSVTQLRYDLRKLKAHALLDRDGRSYRYRLTDHGTKVAAMFVLFHKHVCGPLANTLFHHRLSITSAPPAKIETAYHQADDAIQHLIDVVAA